VLLIVDSKRKRQLKTINSWFNCPHWPKLRTLINSLSSPSSGNKQRRKILNRTSWKFRTGNLTHLSTKHLQASPKYLRSNATC